MSSTDSEKFMTKAKTKNKSSRTLEDKGSGSSEEGSEDAEETVRVLTQRFLRWTSEDLFDFNPNYAKSLRGILNIGQIILTMIVMTLIGAACHYPLATHSLFFKCHSSAAFLFVVACSAFVHSILQLICCLLSKKGDRIIQMTPLEVVHYIVYFIFFCIGGVALEMNLTSKDQGYSTIMAGGIFGITNSVLYLLSAMWFFIYHQMKRRECRHERRKRSRRRSSDSD